MFDNEPLARAIAIFILAVTHREMEPNLFPCFVKTIQATLIVGAMIPIAAAVEYWGMFRAVTYSRKSDNENL